MKTPRFTLRQLEIFAAVMHHGQIRGAAESVHLSDAAVSQSLTELAGALGVRLFERHGRRLVPTATGRQLAVLAEEPLASLHQIPAKLFVAESEATLGGSIRLAASSTIARYVLPRALAALKQSHPDTSITLVADNSAGVEERVTEGDVDTGFIEGPNHSAEVVASPWRTDVMQIIAPPDYPVNTVTIDRLDAHAWIGREAGSGSRAVFEQSLALSGYPTPVATFTCNDTGAIVRAVAGGAGLACVSRYAARQARANAVIQEINLPGLALERPLWRIEARATQSHQPPIVSHYLRLIDEWLDANGPKRLADPV